ncbi:MAG TPA: S8 family serine peptidase [Candidatus Limnocylindrales bacterium]
MRRPFACLSLALVLVLPVVGPAAAAEPVPSDPAANAAPTVEPAPPSAEPAPPSAEPTPAADPAPPTDEPPPTVEPAPPADEPAPAAEPSTAPDSPDDATIPDPTGRYIVMLAAGADTDGVKTRMRQREGITPIRSFARAFRGFSARLDATQRRALRADPDVVMVVPDEVIELTAQTIPNGIRRIGGRSSSAAGINGLDQRVDADVAVVDTGIALVPDLNVAGGYNCSSSDRTAWRDNHGHGTHVAGTVGALDNDFGVVGVAPGVRLWAVKILNSDGYGLLSWYVCGLDWILAQRDPSNSSRPMFESVNMSVAKSGADDKACGTVNADVLHAAICRVVAGGITVVAAAANDSGSATHRVPAAYNEVITVSALADTDGKPGGLGGKRCYSWGTYDKDDTFANFSNYGHDVDLIAPGKCIYSTLRTGSYGYMSGTSMAAPAVAGAAALYKASRPLATPGEVKASLQYLGNLNWKTSTDPDSRHEKLLGVERLGNLGSFALRDPATGGPFGEVGGTKEVPISITRSTTFFEAVRLSVSNVPSGWSATLNATILVGWTATGTKLRVTVPRNTRAGTYTIRVTATNWGRTDSINVPVLVENDAPTARAATGKVVNGSAGTTSAPVRFAWSAATDPSTAIGGYELQVRRNGGPWGASTPLPASARSVVRWVAIGSTYETRIKAVDAVGNWSSWVTSAPTRVTLVDDRSTAISYSASWTKTTSSAAFAGTLRRSASVGARISYSFTGRGISVVAPRGPRRAKLAVYLDGVYKKTVDLRTSTTQHRRVIYNGSWSSSGAHRITLKIVSSGKVQLDAFFVTN